MKTPKEYQPPGEPKNFSIHMTAEANHMNKITLKLDATEFIIDWGDDTITSERDHKYKFKGVYPIRVKGKGLTKLDVRECSLSSLNVVEAPDLLVLDCAHNPLKVLKLPKLINLHELNCYGCEVEKIDVRNWTNLERLNCSKNFITELYVTNCSNLHVLLCAENRLASLTTKGCERLDWMDCSDNKFNAEELHLLCESLPSVTNPKGGHICLGGNEGARSCEITKFNAKCWNVDDFKLSRGSYL